MNIFGMNIGWQRREQVPNAENHAEGVEVKDAKGAALPDMTSYVRSIRAALEIATFKRAIVARMNTMGMIVTRYQSLDDKHGGNYIDYMRSEGRVLNYLLSKRPNPVMNAVDFWKQVEFHVVTEGNAVAYVKRDAYDDIKAVYLCTAAAVNPATMQYSVTYQSERGPISALLDMEDVLHFKSDILSPDGLYGIGNLQLAFTTLTLAATNNRRALRIASKGGDMKYLVSEDNKNSQVGATRRLTKEQKDTVTQSLQEQMNDPEKTVYLYSNLMEVNPITDPNSMQILAEMRKMDVLDIARHMDVPPFIVFDYTNNTYKAPDQGNQELLSRFVQPRMAAIVSELESKIIGMGGYGKMRFFADASALTALDMKTRSEIAKTLTEIGVMCVNETRHEFNLPALDEKEGGNQHLVSTNLQKLDDIKLGKNQAEPTQTQTKTKTEEDE